MFRSYQHDCVVLLNDRKMVSNFKNCVDHGKNRIDKGKQSFRSCKNDNIDDIDILEYEEDEVASKNLVANSEDKIGELN